MPRDGSLTPRDLIEKLAVLLAECDKCGRSGRFRVTTLAKSIGWDGKLTDWFRIYLRCCSLRQNPEVLWICVFSHK
jgi:hypothetical protein